MVTVDLSSAFDTVDYDIFLLDIVKTNLKTRIKSFINANLRGRQSNVEFRASSSKFRKLKTRDSDPDTDPHVFCPVRIQIRKKCGSGSGPKRERNE